MTVKTRFAPSPTGYLHIGSARTALFNYLFAKKYNGEFLLRIEDTDIERSTNEAKQAILNSMQWLGLQHDGEIIYQSSRKDRHIDIANQLLLEGKAYYCYTSQKEIDDLRTKAREKKEHFIFQSKWRDATSDQYPSDKKPVIRLKAPREGETIVTDLLQGEVVVQNVHLDDMILLRSDGSPTYMLAVVVDDHDMGITHIIRGDDHLSNAHRQQLIYSAMGWDIPYMVHIPLIYGPDGAKLSKRHGAIGTEKYREMGYLPDALKNYLLRLGWSHGNEEIISKEQAIKWFDIDGLGKSPSRIDFNKMKSMNAIYLRKEDNFTLANMIYSQYSDNLSARSKKSILEGIDIMKPRAELIIDLYDLSQMFIIGSPLRISEEAKSIMLEFDSIIKQRVIEAIEALSEYNNDNIQLSFKQIAEEYGLKLGDLMKYIRAYITGRESSPSVFEIMSIIGKEESLLRLRQ